MKRPDCPATPAIRALRALGIAFEAHTYPFEMHGGTHHVAECLHIPEHRVIKTLVMEDERRQPFLVLMHGDCEVSTRSLARQTHRRHVNPCGERDAQRITGYMVGGISPFGTRTPLSVYVQSSIFELDCIFINGGKRGLVVQMDPADLERALTVTRVDVAIPP
ncbi:MAG TPA: aminoacyl-tRNA deacylase [Deltaproteobacteria bacterium]|nr:aminoacyl-tRNA deacylase [Deltaproteobacteria bacterium]